MKARLSLLVILLLLFACREREVVIKDLYHPRFSGATLAFDLSSPIYRCELIVKGTQKRDYNFMFPFAAKDFKNDVKILSSAAGYDQFSVIRFKGLEQSATISFLPQLRTFSPRETNLMMPSGAGTYMVENGLERMFVYDYNYVAKLIKNIAATDIEHDSLNLIAIRLPEKAKGTEIERGKTTIPEPIESEDNLKIFPGTGKDKLVVKYALDEDVLTEKRGFYLIIKAIILGLLPAMELILLASIGSKRTRKKIGIGVIVLEFLLLGAMIFFSVTGQFVGIDVISDAVSSSIVAILMSIIVYVKS